MSERGMRDIFGKWLTPQPAEPAANPCQEIPLTINATAVETAEQARRRAKWPMDKTLEGRKFEPVSPELRKKMDEAIKASIEAMKASPGSYSGGWDSGSHKTVYESGPGYPLPPDPTRIKYGSLVGVGGAISAATIKAGSISADKIVGKLDLDNCSPDALIQIGGQTYTKQELQELLEPHPKGDDMAHKLTAAEKALLEDVGRDIVRMGKDLDAIFEIDGTPTLTIRKDSGEYRKKPMMHGWGFFLTDAYVGNRDQLIFVLDPVDPEREMKSIEVSAKEADNALPLMGSALAEGFHLNCERMPELVGKLVDRAKQALVKEQAEAEAVVASNPNWGRF